MWTFHPVRCNYKQIKGTVSFFNKERNGIVGKLLWCKRDIFLLQHFILTSNYSFEPSLFISVEVNVLISDPKRNDKYVQMLKQKQTPHQKGNRRKSARCKDSLHRDNTKKSTPAQSLVCRVTKNDGLETAERRHLEPSLYLIIKSAIVWS